MTIIRPPAIAGSFYPADADLLKSEIDGLLDAALHADIAHGDTLPKAIIVPHAGLMFSGAIAALGFATVRALKDTVRRIVIIGPAHRMAFQGIALAKADGFATPLGNVRCDLPGLQAALALPQVQILDEAHRQEHGLEIELPFVQRLFGESADVAIVPLLVSHCAPRQVHEVIEKLWGGPETLIVISSDLSHFHDYDTARRLDNHTRDMIERLDAENITPRDACGALPVAGMLLSARKRGMTIQTLGMRNSGDVTGDKSRVVGYGAWAIYPAPEPASTGKGDESRTRGLADTNGTAGTTDTGGTGGDTGFVRATEELITRHGPAILDLCRRSILHGLVTGSPLSPSDYGKGGANGPSNGRDHHDGPTATGSSPDLSPAVLSALAAKGASFVTLKKSGRLRGCIGSVIAHRDLAGDLCENAFKAAFRDPRFPPLAADEIDDSLELSISVLSPPQAFPFSNEADLIGKLTPFEDGIILSEGNQRGLFLPQVWEQLPDPADFLAHLKRKAGLPMDYWSDTLRAQRFVTRGISSASIATTGFWQHES